MGKIIEYINSNLDIGEEYYGIFGKKIPTGKMYCPFHDNTNTPAAKRYGNVIHCFSCGRSYSVYDLLKRFNPKRIEEVKTSCILPDVVTTKFVGKKFPIINVDRSKTIPEILKDIFYEV